jgi:hypothetical protein
MGLTEGIFDNISASEYYAIGLDQAVSYSSVSAFASEPTARHYYAKYLSTNAPKQTFNSAFYKGSLFHSLCEYGEERFFTKHFMLPREVRKGSSEYLRLLAEDKSKKPVREQDLAPVLAMYRNLASTKTFQDIAKKARHEVSMFWQHSGYWIKGRADVVLPGLILDFKTTKNANPFTEQGFQSSIDQYRYNAQAAFYTWGMEKITGVKHRFAIAAVEKEYPYECAFYEITPAQIARGMETIRPHLDAMIHCLKTGDWGDGYGDVFHTPDSIGKAANTNINTMITRVSA